jgi:hypothetical protein
MHVSLRCSRKRLDYPRPPLQNAKLASCPGALDAQAPLTDAARMRLHRAETVLLPTWLCVPLLTLGVFFVLWWPFGIVGWGTYAIALAVSIAIGLFTHLRYETTVLERSTEAVVVRFARRKRPLDPSAAPQP